MREFRTMKYHFKATNNEKKLLKFLCRISKNVYNCALYDLRKQYFETKSICTAFDMNMRIKNNINYRFDYYLAELDGSYKFNCSESFKTAFEIEFEFDKYELKEFNGFALENRYEITMEEDVKVYQFFYSRKQYNLNIFIDEKIIYTKSFLYGEVIDFDFILWSNLVARCVPTSWKSSTMIISTITATIITASSNL